MTEYVKLPDTKGPKFLKELGRLDLYYLKEETLSAYCHNKQYVECARCGEDDVRVLQLDHKFNDGADSREHLTGDRSLGGAAYYYKLKGLGYPNKDRYQVLCSNCHIIKGYEDRCGISDFSTEPR